MLVALVETHRAFPTRYRYETEAAPPRSFGAPQVTRRPPLRGEAFNAVTGPGRVTDPFGVTGADGLEGAEVPAAFVAVTVKVYAVPLVRPVTVHDVVDDVQERPPGDAVAV